MKMKRFNKKGQSLVETALVLPIILIMLTGIIDFGMLFNNYLVITNAAREGARSAVVGYTDTEISEMITSLTTSLNQTKITTTITPLQSSRKRGDEVTVTIDYQNSLITPIISAIIPNPVHLHATTVMRME